MGGCASTPAHVAPVYEDPLEVRLREARTHLAKAEVLLEMVSRHERNLLEDMAIRCLTSYLQQMAMHAFKEFDRSKRDDLINMAQKCRRITAHRTALLKKEHERNQLRLPPAERAAFRPSDPKPPTKLEPWEWSEWVAMCKGSGDIEEALKAMGLLKMESKETVALRLAEASSAKVMLNNQVNPNISVSPTISPTIEGPKTTISGPTTSTAVNPNLSNAQTGEGSVAPATGSTTASSGLQGVHLAAAPAPALQGGPTLQGGPMMLVPAATGGFMMVPVGGSGDFGAMVAQQQAMLAGQQPMQAMGQAQAMMMIGQQPVMMGQQPMFFQMGASPMQGGFAAAGMTAAGVPATGMPVSPSAPTMPSAPLPPATACHA